jgi:2-polyprenyl-3-methyl-5-hydroxy-6-metoxy-1,4-benzoquinol methylase
MGIVDTVRLYSNFIRLRIKNGDPREYDRHWEKYWSSVDRTGVDGQVVWDSRPELAAAQDLEHFLGHMDRSLPIVDIGCGNGRQSRYLSKYFPKVIGVDVSAAAIELARRETTEETNVEFRVLNATKPDQAEAFHREFGDVNVYMRTVLHVIQKADRASFVKSLATLLGTKGTLYQIELASTALNYFRSLPDKGKMGLPSLIEKVVENGPIPVGFDVQERQVYYPDNLWDILEEKDHVTVSTIPIGGQPGRVPANYTVMRPKAALAAAS